MFTTGMIVAYAGNEPPEGWLFCDGNDIPEGDQFHPLRALIGDKLPLFNGAASRTIGRSVSNGASHQTGTSTQRGTSKSEGVSHQQSESVTFSRSEGRHRSQDHPSIEDLRYPGPPIRYIIKI